MNPHPASCSGADIYPEVEGQAFPPKEGHDSDLSPPTIPEMGSCPAADWTYQGGDPKSRIIVADFRKMAEGPLPQNTRKYLLELWRRTDITVLCKNICGMTTEDVYNGLESDYTADKTELYDNFRLFSRTGSKDGYEMWQECEPALGKCEDFVKYSNSITETGRGTMEYVVEVGENPGKKTLDSSSQAIYLLDLPINRSNSITEAFEKGLKLDGFLPGKDWCLTRVVSSWEW